MAMITWEGKGPPWAVALKMMMKSLLSASHLIAFVNLFKILVLHLDDAIVLILDIYYHSLLKWA